MKKLKRLVSLFHHMREAYWKWKYEDDPNDWDMTRYSPDPQEKDPWHPSILKITVTDQKTKDELLTASRYVHNRNIDTDFMMVNTLAHLYQRPELISVKE